MSVRNGIVLLLAISTLAFLPGCGSSNSSTPPVAPPSGAFSDSNLNGTYVFSVSGTDLNGEPYAIVGNFTAGGSGGNGRGTISGGSIDINDSASGVLVFDQPINSNSYYQINVDGRGQATLGTSTAFSNITLDFVLQDSFHGLVTEFDGTASGSGTIDQQTASVTPAGAYAFSLSGADASGSFATIGNFTVGSGGAITGLEDVNSGDIAYPNLTLTGSITAGPSATPSTTLDTSFSNSVGGALTFDVFPIDATHLKFIEADGFGTLSGDAYSQTNTTLSAGAMAFTLAGVISGDPTAAGGFMVLDGAGNITDASTEDFNEPGIQTSSAAFPFTATYAAAGAGRYTLTGFSGFLGGTDYAAYPSSGGVFLLEIDDSGIMAGAAYPQTMPLPVLAASEGYGLNLSGYNVANTIEVDDIAEFTTASGGTLTGIIDENYPGANPALYGLALSSGTYGSIDANGRYGLSAAAGNSNVSTLNEGFNLTLYTVDGTTFPFIESDTSQVATGVIVQQNVSATSAVAAKSKSHMFVVRPLIQPHAAKEKKKLPL